MMSSAINELAFKKKKSNVFNFATLKESLVSQTRVRGLLGLIHHKMKTRGIAGGEDGRKKRSCGVEAYHRGERN